MVNVLGIDPGKRNCWWVAFTLGGKMGRELRLLKSDQLDMYPDESIDLQLLGVESGLRFVLNTVKPKWVFAERYIPRRGGTRGNVSEKVNQLLGMLWAFRNNGPRTFQVQYFTAAQHKQWRGEDKRWYSWWKENKSFNVHQSDACSIAYYGWHKKVLLEEEKNYDFRRLSGTKS
jgi:Holliday junction resolvasome RuvABC endonuclease subunit